MHVEVYGILNEEFIRGYQEVNKEMTLDLNSDLYKLYKLEAVSFLLNVFLNEVSEDEKITNSYLEQFNIM